MFNVVLEDPNGTKFDAKTDGGEDKCICHVVIKGKEGAGQGDMFASMKERIHSANAIQGHKNWGQQFKDAIFQIGDGDDEEKDDSAEKPAPAKKPKVGYADLEKESTKHAVIVSAKAKRTGNIKESESSRSGTKVVATSTAKHNRETVLETHVPIHHTSEVAMAGTAGPVISDKAPADMKKPTVVKQGSLNE